MKNCLFLFFLEECIYPGKINSNENFDNFVICYESSVNPIDFECIFSDRTIYLEFTFLVLLFNLSSD